MRSRCSSSASAEAFLAGDGAMRIAHDGGAPRFRTGKQKCRVRPLAPKKAFYLRAGGLPRIDVCQTGAAFHRGDESQTKFERDRSLRM